MRSVLCTVTFPQNSSLCAHSQTHCFNVNFPTLKVLKTHNNFNFPLLMVRWCADVVIFIMPKKWQINILCHREISFLWAMTTTTLYILGLGDETHQNLFSSSEKFETSLHPPSTFHFPALACAALLHNYGSDREGWREGEKMWGNLLKSILMSSIWRSRLLTSMKYHPVSAYLGVSHF